MKLLLTWCLGALVVNFPAFAETNINVPTNQPFRQWELIIIHHSATKAGNADEFDTAHRARGMINGLAYHFVINNGTEGMSDGNVEIGARWEKQIQGGHCRQADINERGIGICLVGDFTKTAPTTKQIDALVSLVRDLQQRFKIQDDHILGHGEVVGEFTECPGKQFPWEAFKQRLKPPAPVAQTIASPPDPLPQTAGGQPSKESPLPGGKEELPHSQRGVGDGSRP